MTDGLILSKHKNALNKTFYQVTLVSGEYSLSLGEPQNLSFDAASSIGIAALGSAMNKTLSEIPLRVQGASNASDAVNAAVDRVTLCIEKWEKHSEGVRGLIEQQFQEFAAVYLLSAPAKDGDRLRVLLEGLKKEILTVVDSRLKPSP